MHEISASTARSSDIMALIDSIAQTSILALNAAITADHKRTGDRAGALQWWPVKCAAWQRSACRGQRIKVLIQSSVTAVDGGVRHVERGRAMKDIVSSVQRVGDIISEITAAASRQSAGIGQVNQSVAEIDRMTQQNAALVEESAATAESLREQAIPVASGAAVPVWLTPGFAGPAASRRPHRKACLPEPAPRALLG